MVNDFINMEPERKRVWPLLLSAATLGLIVGGVGTFAVLHYNNTDDKVTTIPPKTGVRRPPVGTPPQDPLERARWLLTNYVSIDGHNDIPWQFRGRAQNRVNPSNINMRIEQNNGLQTDIPKLRRGLLTGQFWSVYTSCAHQYKDGVRATMEQIDVMKRVIDEYSDTFQIARTADEIETAFHNGKIASLFGMEGGHSVDSSLAALRSFYELGARYMTLTHNCHEPWVDSCCFPSATNPTQPNNGLTLFGYQMIQEMFRLGMFVDLSHTSPKTMTDVLTIPDAPPVIFSHSAARALCNVSRNVPDDVLHLLKANGGVIMIVFANMFVNCGGGVTTIDHVVDHMEHIRKLHGSADWIGLGADYDGVTGLPQGLETVDGYPRLLARMIERGWSDEDIIKVIGGNLLRAMREMEETARRLQQETLPGQGLVPSVPNSACRAGVPLDAENDNDVEVRRR